MPSAGVPSAGVPSAGVPVPCTHAHRGPSVFSCQACVTYNLLDAVIKKDFSAGGETDKGTLICAFPCALADNKGTLYAGGIDTAHA